MNLKERLGMHEKSQAVQTSRNSASPLEGWLGDISFGAPEYGLYSAMRQNVPVIDAALDKIVRLTGGFAVECENPALQGEMDAFVRDVRVGACSVGLRQFIETHFHSLLTYGNAVGEIIPNREGDDIFALYNANLSHIRIRRGESPLEISVLSSKDGLIFTPIPYPRLVLFTALNPPPGEVKGASLLRSLPFMSDILLKIFSSIGTNFERIANLRYAVTYKPGTSVLDKAYAKEIANGISREWAQAMASSKSGIIKDFVAVGDVDIKVIGADNQMIDTGIPIRQVLEQIVAKLGIPPFMLGLHWSSTERMSTQQADILTSELESYRALLDGVIRRICDTFLQIKGYGSGMKVVWDNINLQDEVESANAKFLLAQAENLQSKAK